MALYDKWDVKNDFAYVLHFFSLISAGLDSVKQFGFIFVQYFHCIYDESFISAHKNISNEILHI